MGVSGGGVVDTGHQERISIKMNAMFVYCHRIVESNEVLVHVHIRKRIGLVEANGFP